MKKDTRRKVKVSYDPVGDLLEIELRNTKKVYDIIDGGNGVDILVDKRGRILGIQIWNLSKHLKKKPKTIKITK